MTADEELTFTASGYDWADHPRGINCTWSIVGTGNLQDETSASVTFVATLQGVWTLRCTDRAISGSATVTVTPGALDRIYVSPSPSSVGIGETMTLQARGEDRDTNPRALTDVRWSTTIGQVSQEPPPATTAEFHAGLSVGTGTITAREGAVAGTATVFVTEDRVPRIQGVILGDTRPEDDPTEWRMDLTPFASNQPDPADTLENLRWEISAHDGANVTIFGTGAFGGHTLDVTPVRDAWGTDVVTLSLVDRGGARDSQDVSFTLISVNDPPRWCIPDVLLEGDEDGMLRIGVAHGRNHTFDFLPYVCDVDHDPSELTLITNDPRHVRVSGLAATFSYDEADAGERLLEITVSDGRGSSATLVKVDVTGNPPPQHVRPLPSVTLDEDGALGNALTVPLSNFFRDPAGEPLAFVTHPLTNLATWLNDSGANVTIAGKRDFCGTERVTIRATDPNGLFTEGTLQATVRCVNDPPVLRWTEDVHVRWDVRYPLDLTLFLSDVDNAPEDLQLTSDDAFLAAVDRFALSLLYPWGPAPYSRTLNVTVSDGSASSTRGIAIRVSGNRPPELVLGLPLLRFLEDTSPDAIDLQVHFEDQEDRDRKAHV